jgi:hypothetical protein
MREHVWTLSRALQGLCIRIAKALNAMMERPGGVFADHYWSRLLRTPTELVRRSATSSEITSTTMASAASTGSAPLPSRHRTGRQS